MFDWRALRKAVAATMFAIVVAGVAGLVMFAVGHFFGLVGIAIVQLGLVITFLYQTYKR